MPTIKERAAAALAELRALPVTRPSKADPEKHESLVLWALRHASYDWAAIDSVMFPDGNPLALDLSDPNVAAAWKAVRHEQRATIEGLLDAAWSSSDSYFVYDEGGLRVELDVAQLRAMDAASTPPGAVADLIGKHFPAQWRVKHMASGPVTAAMRVGVTIDPEKGKIPYLNAVLADRQRSIWGSYFLSSWADSGSPDVGTRAEQALSELLAFDWADYIRRSTRDWERWYKHFLVNQSAIQQPQSDTHVRVADWLRKRIDKARQGLILDTALDQFTALPVIGARAKNAKAGRTWGIELEIIDAGAIAYDAAGGWKRERDGSLRQQIGDGRVYDPWEFVSPILDSTFSQGLWMICDQAKHTVKYYKAGVHVHVSATTRAKKVYDPKTRRSTVIPGRRMTTGEVSRLIELYATVSPLLDPIIQRSKTREFCVPTQIDQWAKGWFTAPQTSKKPHRVKPLRQRKDDALENAKVWAQITKGPNHDAEPTEWKRHQELNLQSLNKYGTIEFRSMGAVYDYEYLIRWAWLCRAMVDYAQSDAPISAVYTVTDFDSLVALLMPTAAEPLALKKTKSAKAA